MTGRRQNVRPLHTTPSGRWRGEKIPLDAPEGCSAWIQEHVSEGYWQWHVELLRNRAHGECDTREMAEDIVRILLSESWT